jgi:tRNA pseudouridine38-40 synthase
MLIVLMARYQVILAYDGTRFVGSQRQAATELDPRAKKRTVQGEMEIALHNLGWAGRSVILAGRTDTGVHATGQVVAFDLDWQHSDEDLLRALNANLPPDMAVRDVRIAPPKFHPRFHATSRRYRYRLFCDAVRNPVREKFAWRVWPGVDGDKLKAVAPLFVGQHDFAVYGTPPRTKGSTFRTVMNSSWQLVDDEWRYEVQADAFLYRMVRRLVFVQVAVAQGKLSIGAVARSLARQAEGVALSVPAPVERSAPGSKETDRSELPSGLAPAHGLMLVEVTYPAETC